MVFKKKNKEEDFEEEVEEDFEEEVEEDFDDENTINNSLEIGGQIHQQSKIITENFPQLPKDTKYSKFANMDVSNFILKSKTYQLWNYVNKCTFISKHEMERVKLERKKIYEIRTPEQFKKYLEEIGKIYIWYNFMQLKPEEFKESFENLVVQLKQAKEDGIVDAMYKEREIFYFAYNKYTDEKRTEAADIDDFGLMNTMMTLTEVKKAHGGWGMNSINTTITVTKDENPEKEAEEEPEDAENKGFINKFKK